MDRGPRIEMADKRLQAVAVGKKSDGFLLPFPGLSFSWNPQEGFYPSGGLLGSVGQMGVGFGVSPNCPKPTNNRAKVPGTDLYVKYVSPEVGYRVLGAATASAVEATDVIEEAVVSRATVAPFETIRTHLMVGSNGNSTAEVFQSINEDNFVNVIRVAPSKAIELFAYDTAKKVLTPKNGELPKLPIPPSIVAGAFAGVSSTLCTYPLELLKTRLTVQRDIYDNLLHAFLKIVLEEGPSELYRGLTPSLIGVMPYAATNYFAYDTLKKLYRKTFKTEEISNAAILLVGSAAGAISSTTTFPLEVAQKHMQVGAVGGRKVYKNMLQVLLSILEKEGIRGLYKGLGPSCMKLVPAAGISFMCYEACKNVLINEAEEDA
ncbi:hypothetical protein OPV22_023924 [Ensete ventricosum]|uniref:Uncharacterized protein n=1 Tax=Ensete ventricosum TaxID=4639 RepID=A0AAV8QTZ7_ENSVE|nr:hypothetical protein OPV22_023924 [Ensete ventricosum]